MNINLDLNIEYDIKPIFTKATLMNFLCQDSDNDCLTLNETKKCVKKYLSKIPDQILNVFSQKNWKIVITNEKLEEKFGYNFEIWGLTDFENKTIYTYASEKAINYGLGHEIGHFIDMYMGNLSDTMQWENLVQTINTKVTTSYYFTLGICENKNQEYFADYFMLYINDNDLAKICSSKVYSFWNKLFLNLNEIIRVIEEELIKKQKMNNILHCVAELDEIIKEKKYKYEYK